MGDRVSLADGTHVVVVELRVLMYTDVMVGGQRYRMLGNCYLSEV